MNPFSFFLYRENVFKGLHSLAHITFLGGHWRSSMVLLGAIDQGTSSSRFIVFESDSGSSVAEHQVF